MAARLFDFDQGWRERGHPVLAGADEAGVGPWAGPVVAAAVVLNPGTAWPSLNDSKKLTPKQRDVLFDVIRAEARAFAVAVVDARTVDEINVLQAAHLAVRDALAGLSLRPDLVLFDGNRPVSRCPFPQKTLIK